MPDAQTIQPKIDFSTFKKYVVAITPLFFLIFSHFSHSANISALETRVESLESSSTISPESILDTIDEAKKVFSSKKTALKSSASHLSGPKGANGPKQPK